MSGVITIDCDNVLADSARAFLAYCEQKYNQKVAYEDITQAYRQDNPVFDFVDWSDLGVLFDDFFGTVHEQEMMAPLPGAHEIVTSLAAKGYELHVVTGRMAHLKKLTQEWVKKYFPGLFVEIHCGNDGSAQHVTKGEMCDGLGAVLHIDDFYHYAQTIADVGITTLLFDAPWNQRPSDQESIVRISGWDEVMKHVV